jgi:hypothetical protein
MAGFDIRGLSLQRRARRAPSRILTLTNHVDGLLVVLTGHVASLLNGLHALRPSVEAGKQPAVKKFWTSGLITTWAAAEAETAGTKWADRETAVMALTFRLELLRASATVTGSSLNMLWPASSTIALSRRPPWSPQLPLRLYVHGGPVTVVGAGTLSDVIADGLASVAASATPSDSVAAEWEQALASQHADLLERTLGGFTRWSSKFGAMEAAVAAVAADGATACTFETLTAVGLFTNDATQTSSAYVPDASRDQDLLGAVRWGASQVLGLKGALARVAANLGAVLRGHGHAATATADLAWSGRIASSKLLELMAVQHGLESEWGIVVAGDSNEPTGPCGHPTLAVWSVDGQGATFATHLAELIRRLHALSETGHATVLSEGQFAGAPDFDGYSGETHGDDARVGGGAPWTIAGVNGCAGAGLLCWASTTTMLPATIVGAELLSERSRSANGREGPTWPVSGIAPDSGDTVLVHHVSPNECTTWWMGIVGPRTGDEPWQVVVPLRPIESACGDHLDPAVGWSACVDRSGSHGASGMGMAVASAANRVALYGILDAAKDAARSCRSSHVAVDTAGGSTAAGQTLTVYGEGDGSSAAAAGHELAHAVTRLLAGPHHGNAIASGTCSTLSSTSERLHFVTSSLMMAVSAGVDVSLIAAHLASLFVHPTGSHSFRAPLEIVRHALSFEADGNDESLLARLHRAAVQDANGSQENPIGRVGSPALLNILPPVARTPANALVVAWMLQDAAFLASVVSLRDHVESAPADDDSSAEPVTGGDAWMVAAASLTETVLRAAHFHTMALASEIVAKAPGSAALLIQTFARYRRAGGARRHCGAAAIQMIRAADDLTSCDRCQAPLVNSSTWYEFKGATAYVPRSVPEHSSSAATATWSELCIACFDHERQAVTMLVGDGSVATPPIHFGAWTLHVAGEAARSDQASAADGSDAVDTAADDAGDSPDDARRSPAASSQESPSGAAASYDSDDDDSDASHDAIADSVGDRAGAARLSSIPGEGGAPDGSPSTAGDARAKTKAPSELLGPAFPPRLDELGHAKGGSGVQPRLMVLESVASMSRQAAAHVCGCCARNVSEATNMTTSWKGPIVCDADECAVSVSATPVSVRSGTTDSWGYVVTFVGPPDGQRRTEAYHVDDFNPFETEAVDRVGGKIAAAVTAALNERSGDRDEISTVASLRDTLSRQVTALDAAIIELKRKRADADTSSRDDGSSDGGRARRRSSSRLRDTQEETAR